MDWYVCVYVNRSEILSDLYSSIIRLLGISIILGLSIIIILRIFVKKFVLKRISKLGKEVAKIATGDLNSQIEITSNDEIGVLENGFVNMQKSLINQFEELKLNEMELKAKEEKYRTLIETTSEGFWLIDHKQNTIDVNQSLCDMLGYIKNEMMGKTPLDFVDTENRKIFNKQISQIGNSMHRVYEISLKKKDGINVSTIFNTTTLVDDNEKTVGSFAFIKDNSKYKLVEKDLKEKSGELEK